MILPNLKTSKAASEFDSLVVQARKASELLKALSHETRLLILCVLSEGEKSVSDLEDILSLPQAAVSQQLARLRMDNLVETRRDGRMVYYSVSNHEVSAVVAALHDLFCRNVATEAAAPAQEASDVVPFTEA